MALKSHATIIDDVQDSLGSNTTDFTDAIITKKIVEGLNEFSGYCPNIVRETLATTEDSKELDISGIKDMLWISALEFKADKAVRQWRNWTQHYGTIISMDIDFWPKDIDTGIDTDEALDADEAAIDVDADATTAIPVGTIIRIENELYYVTATGTTLTVVPGYGRTTATTHATNKDIKIPQLAYLYCACPHKVLAFTDLIGKISHGAGYTAGVVVMRLDSLGDSDVLPTDALFTISTDSTNTQYRLTQDTTLVSGAGVVNFLPPLAEDVSDTEVMTFAPSTLTPHLETIFIDLVTALTAKSVLPKFIQTIPKSGRNPFRDYMTFWQAQLSITLQKLQREATKYQKPYEILSRS